ncbi:type II toxin-antitoxin system HicA family toxin [Pseudohongiella sp. O18]|uniref:type II toxin-antitoxin system HicA family toxin n=1 Tax=Pseudohongiella sp. O18 TaxID=2904248 RepID=UPI003983D75E
MIRLATGKKLLEKLKDNPKLVFSWRELCAILSYLGYQDIPSKKGSSSYRFVHRDTKHIILLHRTHPQKDVVIGARNDVIKALKETGVLP